MKTIDGIKFHDMYMLMCNYDPEILAGIESAADVQPFTFRSLHSENLDPVSCRFRYTLTRYESARFGNDPRNGITITYGLRESQIESIKNNGKEIEEIVFYCNTPDSTNNIGSVLITEDEESTVRPVKWYEVSIATMPPQSGMNAPFHVAIKYTDGSVQTHEGYWDLELASAIDSDPKYADGGIINGCPRDYNDEGRVTYTYGWYANWDVGNKVRGLYGNYSQRARFEFSHALFESEEDALTYLTTGEGKPMDEEAGDEGEPAEDRITTLFYASNIYSRSYNASDMERVGASTIYIDIQYAKNDGTVLVDKNRAICGYVNTNNAINDSNHFGNIIWMAGPNVKILQTKQSWLNGGSSATKTLPSFSSTTGFYGPLIDGSTIYESRYNTNMFIFANRADAEAFLRGGHPTPIAGGSNAGQFNPDKLVGDPTVYNNPTANITSDMSSCWILNKDQVNELANIFATGLTSQESEENGVIVNTLITAERSFLAHSEPIDAVVDLFWLPFDPREFSENSTSHMSFVSDTYGIFEALGEAVDAAGRAVKGAYSNPIGRAFLPGGNMAGYIESWNEFAEVIKSTVGDTSTANKINVGTHHIE